MALCEKQDGTLCTACCDVISLYKPFTQPELKRARRAFNKRAKLFIEIGMLRQIPRRVAKTRNRFLFDKLKKGGDLKTYTFYKCIHLKNGKCANYSGRPHMCRGYPFYGLTAEEWLSSAQYARGAQYDSECGFYDKERIIQTFNLGD